MAPEGTQREDDEHVSPILSPILEAGAEVEAQLPPGTGSKIVNPVNPNKPAEFVAEHSEEFNATVKYFQAHPDEIKTLFEELAKNQPMLQKTVTFGQMLAIIGITVPVSVALGITIGANLGAISAGLGAVGAGLALAGPTIGFALIGVLGFVAIVALGIAAYKYRGQIKSGAEDIGKKLKDLLKDILDKIPIGVTNAQEFDKNVTNKDAQNMYNPEGNPFPDEVAFKRQYLSDEDGLAALRKYITDAPNNGKITLTDKTELTLKDLNELVAKSKGYSAINKAEFRTLLSKFAPIMHQNNITLRAGIEKIQAEIHTNKKRQTPLPGSPSRPNSIANNELIKLIGENNGDPKGIKDLLQLIAGDDPELKGGLNKEFRQDFYAVLSEKPYELDHKELYELERKGGGDLTKLAKELSKLDNNQIKDLEGEVEKLKKEQAKGPRKNIGDPGASQAESQVPNQTV